jgi:hypothetical protein
MKKISAALGDEKKMGACKCVERAQHTQQHSHTNSHTLTALTHLRIQWTNCTTTRATKHTLELAAQRVRSGCLSCLVCWCGFPATSSVAHARGDRIAVIHLGHRSSHTQTHSEAILATSTVGR